MSKKVRSARGEIVDFELLAIKQQLASAPVPKLVAERKRVIDSKGESQPVQDDGMLDLALEGAETSQRTNSTTQKVN